MAEKEERVLSEEKLDQIAVREAEEEVRRKTQIDLEQRRARLECIRIARDTLLENRRVKPIAEASDITTAGIVEFADALAKYIDGEA